MRGARTRQGGRTKGKRYTLLPYKRTMDRLWKATLVLGLLLAGLWWQGGVGLIVPLDALGDAAVFVGAIVVLGITLFAIVARYMTYVQAFSDHVRVVTPFLRLKISYRRVRSVRPVEFHQLFKPAAFTWSERRFLEPYIGQTVVVLELFSYPLPRRVLRFFLPPYFFHPQMIGFVLVVADWMALSTEIDSLRGAWRTRSA